MHMNVRKPYKKTVPGIEPGTGLWKSGAIRW